MNGNARALVLLPMGDSFLDAFLRDAETLARSDGISEGLFSTLEVPVDRDNASLCSFPASANHQIIQAGSMLLSLHNEVAPFAI